MLFPLPGLLLHPPGNSTAHMPPPFAVFCQTPLFPLLNMGLPVTALISASLVIIAVPEELLLLSECEMRHQTLLKS